MSARHSSSQFLTVLPCAFPNPADFEDEKKVGLHRERDDCGSGDPRNKEVVNDRLLT